jgi:hypothetical protein
MNFAVGTVGKQEDNTDYVSPTVPTVIHRYTQNKIEAHSPSGILLVIVVSYTFKVYFPTIQAYA